jgi:hypothetical protein
MHVWVSIAIGVFSIVFAAGVAWGVVGYRLRRVEKDQAAFKAATESIRDDMRASNEALNSAISELTTTIRTEFDRAIGRINKLLFDEQDGITRYIPRKECGQRHDECRQDLLQRIDKIEQKVG